MHVHVLRIKCQMNLIKMHAYTSRSIKLWYFWGEGGGVLLGQNCYQPVSYLLNTGGTTLFFLNLILRISNRKAWVSDNEFEFLLKIKHGKFDNGLYKTNN